MTIESHTNDAPTPVSAGSARSSRETAAGVGLSLTGSLSNQTGAALAALAFPAIGPAGVVAVRQLIAAVTLGIVGRPTVRGLRWAQWWPILALAATVCVMNLALYTAIERVGLGLAVSLEFLGPLAVALWAFRRSREGLLAVIVALGVYVLVLPGPSTDYLGVGLALVAAACWANYIVLNQVLGQRVAGITGTALATMIAAVVYAPLTVALIVSGRLHGAALGYAVAAGILASAIPYAVDLLALRRADPGLFATLTSLNPVWAALLGMVTLGEYLTAHEWIGMSLIVASNVAAVLSLRRAASRSRAAAPELPLTALPIQAPPVDQLPGDDQLPGNAVVSPGRSRVPFVRPLCSRRRPRTAHR
ncbi:hypothetical protein GCM10027169_38660 [Gordonia jinhuaensis]|uniref:EamA domain-containing protein n=1 Tax=Gordonia jinhuaensis TaxID=1517702 RepID=A0A916WRY2_9ACTN|nr:EamA family transporter [Gordonia jinhuaensis]GGB23951.1 hypothetical protein GCM10011489_10290 [Gordonia jinhuaensis]